MALLRKKRGKKSTAKPGAKALDINGSRYPNSAAKFWSSLLDEVCSDYPECDTLVLDFLSPIELSRDLLFPERSLQRQMDQCRGELDLEQAMRDAIADYALYGPPGIVRLRLLAGSRVKHSCELPSDCVDADLFPHLLVWLLEWARIPECLWNLPEVQGGFSADDRERSLRYDLDFTLEKTHVSEGLLRRELTVRFTLSRC